MCLSATSSTASGVISLPVNPVPPVVIITSIFFWFIQSFKITTMSSLLSFLNENKWIYQTFGKDAGPSINYINPKFKGKFGIIAPYSKDFCKTCNRLRITSRGDLRLCLFGNTGINLRHLLQKDDQLNELKDLILKQMQFKKESHYLELGDTGSTKNLSKTGG